MKVLVYFDPGEKNDCFQGARMRKNIKAALESVGVSWVKNAFALPDVAHFLSPDDEAMAHDLKEDGIKIVVSACYSEDDAFCRYFNRDAAGLLTLKVKAQRFLEMADLILVPSLGAKAALLKAGVSAPNIQILTPGVALSRFEIPDPVERSIFPKYMRCSPREKYVITVGDYEDNDEIADFSMIASLAKNTHFYFFGNTKHGQPSDGLLKRLNRNAPANAHFAEVIEDDIYRSAIVGATGYLSFANHPCYLTALEAFAAKIQPFSYGAPVSGEGLIDKKNCYAYTSVEKTAKAIESYCAGKLAPTIMVGYKAAKAASLPAVGKKLKAYYESLLEGPEETL